MNESVETLGVAFVKGTNEKKIIYEEQAWMNKP